MKNQSEIEETLSRPAIHPAIGAALGTFLALVAIASALIIAAIDPTVNGHVIAVATAMGIGVIAFAVTLATAVLWRIRLSSNNHSWVYW